MEEEKKNVESQDHDAISKVAEAVRSSELTQQQIEEKIDEALKLCYKLIEEKVNDYIPVNANSARRNRLISDLKNNAKVSMFNRVLSEGVDDIKILSQDIAMDTIKPIVPVEDKGEKPVSKTEIRKAEFNRYIEESFEKMVESKNEKSSEDIKLSALSFIPRKYDNIEEKMGDIENIIDEASKDIEDELEELFNQVKSKDINDIPLDDKNVIALALMTRGIRDIAAYSGMEVNEKQKPRILADMTAIAAELNPDNEYNNKYINILSNLAEVTGIDIYEKEKDGTYALDENGTKIISPEKILGQFYKAMKGLMPPKTLEDFKKSNEKEAGALFGDEIPKNVGALKKLAVHMAESIVKNENISVKTDEITDRIFKDEQVRKTEINDSLMSSVIMATKDIAIYSGKVIFDPKEKSNIAKDMCYLAIQDNAIADNYIIKLSKIVGADVVKTDENGKTTINKEEILKYYRGIDEEAYSKLMGSPVSLEDNEEYTFEYLEKELQSQKLYTGELPKNFTEMKKTAEKEANQQMFLDPIIYNYNEKNFKSQVTSLVRGNTKAAQKFLKEFLDNSKKIEPELMERFITVGEIVKHESTMRSVKLATMGMKDLQEYDAEKINDQDKAKILRDMCVMTTDNKSITEDLLIQMANKYKFDVIEKQANGKTKIDNNKLIEMYNEYNDGRNVNIEDLKNKAIFLPDQVYERYIDENLQNDTDILNVAKKVSTHELIKETLVKNSDNFDEKMGQLVKEDTEVAQECLSLFLESSDGLTPQMQARVIRLGEIIKESKDKPKEFLNVDNIDIYQFAKETSILEEKSESIISDDEPSL